MKYNTDYYFSLLSRINSIYNDMVNKDYEAFKRLNDIHAELMALKDEIKPSENDQIVTSIINVCHEQIKLINYLNEEFVKDIEYIRNNFLKLETDHFDIVNKYITGIITMADVKNFENQLSKFKTILYKYNPEENEILEIAKMKSKVQHFTTEILEDEEVLKLAYSNDNK